MTRTLHYYPDTKTLYIELAQGPAASSEALSDDVIVDLDAAGTPVGVTIEGFSPR